MMVAGEASGDAHGAALVIALRRVAPAGQLEFFGAAGPKMREAGVEPTVASDELSVVGIAEIARALPMFLRAKRKLVRAATERRPDVAVLIDFPEFNLKLARSLKKRATKVVYYISPQLWAWRKYRIEGIRKYVDLLLTILPFEKEWYAHNGLDNVQYVGNPLASEVVAETTREEFCGSVGFDPAKPLIALLPGSRGKEIERILPVMLEATERIRSAMPETQFVVALADGRHRKRVETEFQKLSGARGEFAVIVECRTYDALHAADAAAVTSGTATLEAGILGTPMAIVYRTSMLNYVLIKPLVSVEHFGLINLIAGRRVAAELIQGGFTSATLSQEIVRLLDADTNKQMRSDLKDAAEKLGGGGASRRAAAAILELVGWPVTSRPVDK
jgi:lipid-A-disaccharide synthase